MSSRSLGLYHALKAFGQIVKSIFILRVIDEPMLRMSIEKVLSGIEHVHAFTRAVSVGNPRESFRAKELATTRLRVRVALCNIRVSVESCLLLLMRRASKSRGSGICDHRAWRRRTTCGINGLKGSVAALLQPAILQPPTFWRSRNPRASSRKTMPPKCGIP